jgi:phage baseplate assembly protein V
MPQPGAEAMYICLGGMRSQAIVIATDDRRYRLELQDGEVALYSDEGDSIQLNRGRMINVTTETFTVNASTKAIFNTPQVQVSGDVLDQTGTGNAHTVKEMRTIYNGHGHPALNTAPSELM